MTNPWGVGVALSVLALAAISAAILFQSKLWGKLVRRGLNVDGLMMLCFMHTCRDLCCGNTMFGENMGKGGGGLLCYD